MSGQPQPTTHPPASSPVWSHSFLTLSFLVPVLNSCSPRYSFLTRVLPQVRACLARDLWEGPAHEGAQKKLSSVPHGPNSSSEKQREACQDLAKLASLSCSPRPKAVTESGDSKLTTQTLVCCLFSPWGLPLHGHHGYIAASSPGQATFPTIAKALGN